MRLSRFQSALLTVIVGMVALFAGSFQAAGQATSGDVVGIVVDHSGAAIAGAAVKATNVATGVTAATVSGKDGEFHISNLLAGNYDITGSATGFATFTLKNFTVQLSTTATARLTLPVATASTSVEVSAEATAVIDTTTTQLQTTFQSEELRTLPTASTGLGVLNLSLLVPGVASSGAVGIGTGPSVAGLRPRDDNYTIEGIDNNNKGVTGPLIYVPNDAAGEFTVITTQFSPEFGHSSGGQFNTTVRGGTNKIHGSVYEYFQNRNLNAENAVQGGKVPNPRYDNNRYGAQVGGPIKKDKLFYFGNYERQTTGQSGQYYLCTPTADGMTALQNSGLNFNQTNLGIFTKYMPASPSQVDYNADLACGNQQATDANPDPLQGFDVYSDTAYNAATGIFGTAGDTFIPTGNYLVTAPNYVNQWDLTASTDWAISPKDSFRGRYIYNRWTGVDTAAYLPAFFEPLPQRFQLVALSEFHNFTPNLINEARLGFNRFSQDYTTGSFAFPGVDSFPNLTMWDMNGVNIGPDGNAPQSTIQNMYQFTNNISWVKGRHTWKFGFDGRKFIAPQSFTQRVRGDYEWNGTTEYLHDLAPTNFGERSTGNFFYYGDQTALYGFANDTYRVTEKLTLNFGLRYEFTSVPVGERAQNLNIAASVPGLITFNSPQPQKKNFYPRVGINYAPDPDTSIRAGFGMAADVLFDNLGLLSFPPQYSSTNDVGSGSTCTGGTGGLCPNPGDPNFLADGGLPAGNGSLATFPTIADQRAATTAWLPNQSVPYAENWTLGVQHVFAKNYTAEVRYVGTHAIHLPTQIQMNVTPRVTADNQLQTYLTAPAIEVLGGLSSNLYAIQTGSSNILPAFSSQGFTSKITSYQPQSSSNYNGLAASLQRQFQKGLLLNFAYTYSKTMDDATAEVFATVLTPRRPQNSQDVAADYSRSALDRTHRISLVAVYDLPFFKNSSWFVKNLVGNWEVAPIYTYESPEYATALSGINSNLNGDSAAYIDRPIVNAKGQKGTGSGITSYANPNLAVNCPAGTTATDPYGTLLCNQDLVAYVAKNPNAEYIAAGSGTLPTASRNTLPIRPINNIDVTAIKRFSLGEARSIEFAAGAFNVLNHAQYIPGTIDNINSPGYTASTQFQTVTNGNFNLPGKSFNANARAMQLNLKFNF